MDKNSQKLREGTNQFVITGTLKENNLKIRNDLVDKKTGGKYTAIMGDLVVKVGEHDEHTIKLFSKQKTKKGDESKLFKAYKTAMETYTSMADIAGIPEEEREGAYPTRLTVQGELSVNDYYSNNKLNKYSELRGKFVESVKTEDVEDMAEFDAEIYINKIKKELDKDGIETGRLEIEGIIPGYNGIVSPIDFTVTEEYGVADYMATTFEKDDTIVIWGKIINSAIHKKEVKQGFGKSKEDVTTTYKKEILINGGEEFPLGEDKAFNPELITKAMAEREIYLAELKDKGEKEASQPKRNVGFGQNRTSTPTPPEKRTMDDIPF